jgi:hypothetical protein
MKRGFMGQISGLYGVGAWDKWKTLGLGIGLNYKLLRIARYKLKLWGLRIVSATHHFQPNIRSHF